MTRTLRSISITSLLALAACGSPQGTSTAPTSNPSTTAQPSAAAVPEPSITASAVASVAPPPTASAVASVTVAPAPPPPLPEGMKILVIGDSFAEALGAGIRNVSDEFKVKADQQGKSSTFIPQWAGGKFGVPSLMATGKPDVVVISIGGNELAMVDPKPRIPDIQKIIGFMGSTPCVWVRTPTWEAKGWKENDLPEIIRENSSPCRYYDSNKLSPGLPRGSDHIHPTADGQKIWARQILEWMKSERDTGSAKFKFKPRPTDE